MIELSANIKIKGITTRFSGNGRGLGYPTANIHTDIQLRDGIYAGQADLASYKNHPALIFAGIPTTVGDKVWRIETHLLDIPDQDYYDLPIIVELQRFIRPNKTFDSLDDLKLQMKADEDYARDWFARGGPANV